MCCPVWGKVHIKDLFLLIRKSSLGGDSRFPLKKNFIMTICLSSNSRWYENQCSLEASLNKTNFPFFLLYLDATLVMSDKLWSYLHWNYAKLLLAYPNWNAGFSNDSFDSIKLTLHPLLCSNIYLITAPVSKLSMWSQLYVRTLHSIIALCSFNW